MIIGTSHGTIQLNYETDITDCLEPIPPGGEDGKMVHIFNISKHTAVRLLYILDRDENIGTIPLTPGTVRAFAWDSKWGLWRHI